MTPTLPAPPAARFPGAAFVLVSMVATLGVALAGCASRSFKVPEGPGGAFPGYEQAFADATAGCRDLRTLAAEARVSGSVGGGKVRGRVIVGFERPGRMRLEAVAPMGAPAFILAADGGSATLLMPRAGEVLRGEPADRVLDALIGLSLNPDDLLALLAGCLAPDAKPVSGRQFADGWVRVDLEGGSAAYLRQASGAWRLFAGTRPSLAVEYERKEGARPTAVRLEASANGRSGAALRLALAQVEINGSLPANAFEVKVPPGAAAISLEDLRQSGPLGERR